ncbi:duo1p [Saccharomyces arboricola H-6]|uniref:DASH complex subunit DUO1 n=1 Tax=Saccharomyces arboricola (strain H-6 / AS 2.3317 / CBS 10644) TaxID=1160507 RepID=J8PNR0_SACAR|nr:duo1p [Saccharomyces arboricola H-6]
MSEQSQLDDSTIDKLIPQIFNEMRSNLNSTTNKSSKNMEKGNLLAANTSIRPFNSITTQSLLKESESLDKISSMIQNVTNALRNNLPVYINQVHEVCKSTNSILDSWINIHSQAGYIHKLMSDQTYLKLINERLNHEKTNANDEDGSTLHNVIALKKREVLDLRQELESKKKEKDEVPSKSTNQGLNPRYGVQSGRRPVSSTGSVNNSRVRRPHVLASKRPSGIPRVTNRWTKPTASSSRKMFR